MITGIVTADLAAIIRVTVLGKNGQRRKVDALIDTGFDGWLSLPPDIIHSLGLSWRRRGRAIVADGTESVFDIFDGTILWNRRKRRIPIDETSLIPLVGMSLLHRCELRLQIRSQGKVTIRPLNQKP